MYYSYVFQSELDSIAHYRITKNVILTKTLGLFKLCRVPLNNIRHSFHTVLSYHMYCKVKLVWNYFVAKVAKKSLWGNVKSNNMSSGGGTLTV